MEGVIEQLDKNEFCWCIDDVRIAIVNSSSRKEAKKKLKKFIDMVIIGEVRLT